MSRIYVASSWRNKYYPEVVKRLREQGHEVYDFRNPPHGGTGFHWTDVDENAPDWTFDQYAEGLHHPLAERQFAADMEALEWADTCVLVLPCGRSAHTEAGWMAGQGRKTVVYIPEMQEPELMYKLFNVVVGSLDDLVRYLNSDPSKTLAVKRFYRGIERPDYTPDFITELKPDEVFVFGSNLRGAHGGGAAYVAYRHFGAVMGQGVGLQGQSYAIPTMQGGVATIAPYVNEFIAFAKGHPELFFYVTRIGCGIAGFRDEEIAPLFSAALLVDNICLPKTFVGVY